MKEVKDEELVENVKQIIDGGDLQTLTFKKILQQLQEKYESNLEEKKSFLRTTVSQIMDTKHQKEEEEVNVETIDEPETKEIQEPIKEKKEDMEEEDVDVEGGTDDKPKEEEIPISEKERAMQEMIMDSIKYGSTRQTRGGGRRKANTSSNSSTKKNKKKKEK